MSVGELDWEAQDGHQKPEEMGFAQADYIIAGDCLYIDEARSRPSVSAFRAAVK